MNKFIIIIMSFILTVISCLVISCFAKIRFLQNPIIKTNYNPEKSFVYYSRGFILGLFIVFLFVLYGAEKFSNQQKNNDTKSLSSDNPSVTKYEPKSLTICSPSFPDCDPHSLENSLYAQNFYFLVHGRLIDYNVSTKELKIELIDSITKVKTANKEGLSLKLKPNVKFHNGEFLKPSDIKFTIERMRSIHKDNDGNPTSLEKFDMKSSRFDDQSNSVLFFFEDKFTFSEEELYTQLDTMFILNEKACSDNKKSGFQIGLGLYSINQWQNDEHETELNLFRDFYDQKQLNNRPPTQLKIKYREPSQTDIFIQECIIGEGHQAFLFLNDETKLTKLKNNPKIKIQENPSPLFKGYHLIPNCKKIPLKVRLLIRKCINMEQILKDFGLQDSFGFSDNRFITSGLPVKSKNYDYLNTQQLKTEIKQLTDQERQLEICLIHPSEGSLNDRILRKIWDILESYGFKIQLHKRNDFLTLNKDLGDPNSRINLKMLGNSSNKIDLSDCFDSWDKETEDAYSFDHPVFHDLRKNLLNTTPIEFNKKTLVSKEDKLMAINQICLDNVIAIELWQLKKMNHFYQGDFEKELKTLPERFFWSTR